MIGRALNISFRTEAFTLVVCVALSLILLLMPGDIRFDVANWLHAVLVAPYGQAEGFWEDMARLRSDNVELQRRVAEAGLLAATAERRGRDVDRLAGPAVDPGYEGGLLPCEVIVRQSGRFATMLKIRSLAPVDWVPWLPVISLDGYLGRLLEVDGQEAWVELVSAPDFALGVEIEGKGLLGVLRPRGDRFIIEFIGRDEDVEEGDEVITSGVAEIRERGNERMQNLTGRGLKIGTVMSADSPPDQIFKEIIVEPAASFERNVTVFVVLPIGWGGR